MDTRFYPRRRPIAVNYHLYELHRRPSLHRPSFVIISFSVPLVMVSLYPPQDWASVLDVARGAGRQAGLFHMSELVNQQLLRL